MFTIPGGETIEVFRLPAARDRHGDGTPVSIGTVDHVVFQWGSGGSSTRGSFDGNGEFRETAEFKSVAFIPKSASIRVSSRDRFTYRGNKYQVVGQPSWDSTHPMTGFEFGYYMVQIDMVN